MVTTILILFVPVLVISHTLSHYILGVRVGGQDDPIWLSDLPGLAKAQGGLLFPRPVVPITLCWPHFNHHQNKVIGSTEKSAGIKSQSYS